MINNDKSFKEVIDEKLGSLFEKISTGNTSGSLVSDNIMCFTSYCGGSGVSSLVANISKVMASKGLNVIIIDLNVLTPIHWLYTGLVYGNNSYDLHDLVLGSCDLKDSILNGKQISMLGCRNRNVIDENNLNTNIAGENFNKVLDTLSTLYDVVLIDCPYGKFDNILVNTALYRCEKIYSIWTDSYTNWNNYETILSSLRLYGISLSKLRYIYNKRGSSYISENNFKELGIDNFLGILPYDKSVVECDLKGKYYIVDGSGEGRNSGEYYNGLYEITDKILLECGYELNKSSLKDVFNLGNSNNENNKEKPSRFKRKRKGKQVEDEQNNINETYETDEINENVIDEVTGVDEIEINLDEEGV